MFGPYTPLQQLDLLADDGTKSYVVGSTNSLLLQQKDRYSDILINVSKQHPIPNLRKIVLTAILQIQNSLTKIPSTFLLYRSVLPSFSLRLTDDGSIYSPKSSMTHGMRIIRRGPRPSASWALKSSFECNSRSTYLLSCLA